MFIYMIFTVEQFICTVGDASVIMVNSVATVEMLLVRWNYHFQSRLEKRRIRGEVEYEVYTN